MPSEGRLRTRVFIWIGLVVGCIAKFITGSLFVYNVYQDDIKATFNYTQGEMELQPSLLNIGLGFGFFPGMIYDKFGPRVTSIIGIFVSVGAYMLLWSTTKFVTFYKAAGGLTAVYFFLCGLGSTFTYMVALNTNLINFPKKHGGKIVGCLNCFFAGSHSIFSVIYYQVISKNNEEFDRFPTLMLVFAISFGIADIFCAIFLQVYTTETEVNFEDADLDIQMKNVPNPEVTCCNTDSPGQASTEPKTLKGILTDIDYYLLLGLFSCASSVGLVYLNNLTVISKSVHLNSHDQNLTLIVPITNALISFTIGLASDYFKEKVPRMIFIISACVVFTGCSVLSLIAADHYVTLCIATTLCGLGTGIVWTVAPTIMSEMFHISNLGRNWGIALLFAAVLGLGAQYLFGVLYDIHKTSDNNCYGMKCVTGGLAVCLGLAVSSIIFGLILTLKRKYRARNIKYSSFD